MARVRSPSRPGESAGPISLTGDWILIIGLIYRVYAVTGSTVASALTMASSAAPQVLLARPELGFDRLPQLRGDQTAERIAWKVSEAAGTPVDVLQAAETVGGHLQTEQPAHSLPPCRRQVGDG